MPKTLSRRRGPIGTTHAAAADLIVREGVLERERDRTGIPCDRRLSGGATHYRVWFANVLTLSEAIRKLPWKSDCNAT